MTWQLTGEQVWQVIEQAVFRDLATGEDFIAHAALIEVTPEKEFITGGEGVSLMTMRHPGPARGRPRVHNCSQIVKTEFVT